MVLMGYVQGMIDATKTAADAGTLSSAFCVPPNTKNITLKIAVCGYLFTHRADVPDNLDGTGVAGIAIGLAFPCPK